MSCYDEAQAMMLDRECKRKMKNQTEGETEMKKTNEIEVIEPTEDGLRSLLGQRVLLMCSNYFYEGTLKSVNDFCCLLSDAGIVYSTGAWSEKTWEDRQQLPGDHSVTMQSIESFCLSPVA